jgi:hypothetical protein
MIKKIFSCAVFAICSMGISHAQLISFEDLTLPPDSFWNGSDMSGGFNTGICNTHFPNNFVDFGGGYTSWDGFSYSNKTNDSLQDFGNMYSCYAGQQLPGSNIFGVSYNPMNFITYETLPTEIVFPYPAVPQTMMVSNSAYSALTVKNGDFFCKPFGGVSGNDPDWFKLDIIGFNDTTVTDTIHFYLADYRFADSLQDYIVKDWTSINLQALGTVTKMQFLLSSSDTGAYGMNTPAFFCFDDMEPNFLVNVKENQTSDMLLYPSPTTGEVFSDMNITDLEVLSLDGKTVYTKSGLFKSFSLAELPEGIYIVKTLIEGITNYQKIVKK